MEKRLEMNQNESINDFNQNSSNSEEKKRFYFD